MKLKETAKSIKEECEKKEELKNILKAKFEKLRGGNKRYIFVSIFRFFFVMTYVLIKMMLFQTYLYKTDIGNNR